MQALQIWISGANRRLSGLIKKPKIWLLTGIYLLKDATFTGKGKRTAGVQAGINSTVLSATGAPPIGPSIDLEHSNDSSSRTPTQGWLVWAAQYHALDYRVCTKAFGSADITLLYDVVSEGTCYFRAPDWAKGLTVQVAEQSNSLDNGTESFHDNEDYQKIAENFWRCKISQWLTRDKSFYIPKELTPEQQTKHKRWQQTEEEMKSAGHEVYMLHSQREYLLHTQDNLEEQVQLAQDGFMVAEKEYKRALADFKSSLGDQALKE